MLHNIGSLQLLSFSLSLSHPNCVHKYKHPHLFFPLSLPFYERFIRRLNFCICALSLFSVSLSLLIYISLVLPISLFLPIYHSFYLSISLSTILSLFLPIYLSSYLYISFYLSLYFYRSLFLLQIHYVSGYFYLPVHLSVSFYMYLSLSHTPFLSLTLLFSFLQTNTHTLSLSLMNIHFYDTSPFLVYL